MPTGRLQHELDRRDADSVDPMDAARRSLASRSDRGGAADAQQVFYETATALYRDGSANLSWPEAWRQAKAAVGDLIRAGALAAPPYGPWRPARRAPGRQHEAA